MAGSMVPISIVSSDKYKGKVLGAAPYKGQCAAGVQQIFSEAGKSLGVTSDWKQGVPVKGDTSILPGTAIASFKDGKYWRHTAIYVGQTSEGIQVWDQWVSKGKYQVWHQRTLKFDNNDTSDGSNNGNLFYVINK